MPPTYYEIWFGGVFLYNYHIKGGRRLSGEVEISGAKNAVLPILAASVITSGENVFTGCPEISDVDSMIKILKALGCRVSQSGQSLCVDASFLSKCRIPEAFMKEMRSSVFLAGSLLARCGEAVISNPGGCRIGERPIDLHIDGLSRMGAHVRQTEDRIIIKSGKLKGADIALAYPSVGATENLMLAATAADGITRIRNSAREPEIVDLQEYINACGGCVKGAGSDVIEITGGKKLHGCCHRVIPDRIEAATYLLMALATGGEILLKGADRRTMGALISLLEQGGYYIGEDAGGIRAKAAGREKLCCNVSTAPYPGFPTDMQPQLTAFLTRSGRGSVIEENIFENRFGYAKQLKKMGADIEISEKKVIIKDNNILCGTDVEAEDLRGGAALVMAGLMAEGDTVVKNTKYIKRGYGKLEEKIRLIGGDIRGYEE